MFLSFTIRNVILALLFVCNLNPISGLSANVQELDNSSEEVLNELDDNQRVSDNPLDHYQKYSSDELISCTSNSECGRDVGKNLYCDEDYQICTCLLNYERDPEKPKNCRKCPSKEGKKCDTCCFGDNLKCIDGECVRCTRDEDSMNYCTSHDGIFFITASQIILATALVMGITALGAVLLRICANTKRINPRVGVVHAVGSSTPDPLEGRSGIRASLTSLQKRIMSQLKDRPPRYETRHNYEYTRRENPEAVVGQSPLPIPNEPPPNYDGTATANDELPPSYSASVLTANNISSTSNLGTQNDAYVIDPTEVLQTPPTATIIDEQKRNQESCRATDKIVHM